MMPTTPHRRDFLRQSSSIAAATAAATAFAIRLPAVHADEPASADTEKGSPNNTVRVGIMGVNGRGAALANSFMGQPNVHIAAICDVDQRVVGRTLDTVEKKQGKRPEAFVDFRKILDNPNVDVLVVAAPNHWHAPAAILACKAGKHVYVEKPCSHNPREGEIAVAAARKYNRVVNMGNQRRSYPAIVEAMEKIRAGAIGRVLYARTWYNSRRPSIGKGQVTAPPAGLDFELWQGPAPEQPYRDNLVHYNWHWHWHWGNGELGNNGIHSLDVARWALGVDYPKRVTALGGKYRHDDDQQTPDTMMVTYEFGDATITWEGLSWSPYGPGGAGYGMSFHGDQGTLVIDDPGYRLLDLQNKEIAAEKGRGGDGDHLANFLHCVRNGGRPNSDIEEAHKSTLLCHLGNIAYRVGRELNIDPATGNIVGDEQAKSMWSREYQPGWEPTV